MRQKGQSKKGNKRYVDLERGNKSTFICRWHDCLFENLKLTKKKTPKTNKWLQQGCKIQG